MESSSSYRSSPQYYALYSDPATEIESFEQRMRKRLLQQEKDEALRQKKQRYQKEQDEDKIVLKANTLQEYKKVVADENERLVMVRFYSPWCKACKAMTPMWRRIAARYHRDNVKFVDVAATSENSNLIDGLGVPAVPFCHIYHPDAGLVEESRFTKKHVREVAKTLHTYIHKKCDIVKED